jgi:hypothetical protein
MLEKLWFLSGGLLKMSLKSRLWASLIEMIMAKGSNRLKGAINVSENMYVKAMSDKASKSLEMGSFYRNDPFKRKSINALFKRF